MVFYFTSDVVIPHADIFMGRDKFENEHLIKYGWDEDVWFHVDDLSSAHVYLRLPTNKTWENIEESLLIDCAQLVKANSIEGNKKNHIEVIYTPWNNLRKGPEMDVGQIGFHNPKKVKSIMVEKRDNAIINRLNKTKIEKSPNFSEEKEAHIASLNQSRKKLYQDEKIREKNKQEEIQKAKMEASYDTVMNTSQQHYNSEKTEKSIQQIEEDFM